MRKDSSSFRRLYLKRDALSGRAGNVPLGDPQYETVLEALLRRFPMAVHTRQYSAPRELAPDEISSLLDDVRSILAVEREVRWESERQVTHTFASNHWVMGALYDTPGPGRRPNDLDEFLEEPARTFELYFHYVRAKDRELLEQLLAERRILTLDEARLTLRVATARGPATRYITSTSDFVPFAGIQENYSERVVHEVRRAQDQLRRRDNGLIVLNGPPGTGKTYLIRSLLTETRHRQGIICAPPADFLRDINRMLDVTQKAWRPIIVLEDVDDIVSNSAVADHSSELSALLNATDGILASTHKAVFIITFNYQVDRINEAILRTGRCIAHIQTSLLSQAQASRLLGRDLDPGDYSLAELYEARAGGTTPKPQRRTRVGFGGRG